MLYIQDTNDIVAGCILVGRREGDGIRVNKFGFKGRPTNKLHPLITWCILNNYREQTDLYTIALS